MPVIKEIYKYSIDDMIDKDILIDSRAFDYYNPNRKNEEPKKQQLTVRIRQLRRFAKPKLPKLRLRPPGKIPQTQAPANRKTQRPLSALRHKIWLKMNRSKPLRTLRSGENRQACNNAPKYRLTLRKNTPAAQSIMRTDDNQRHVICMAFCIM